MIKKSDDLAIIFYTAYIYTNLSFFLQNTGNYFKFTGKNIFYPFPFQYLSIKKFYKKRPLFFKFINLLLEIYCCKKK